MKKKSTGDIFLQNFAGEFVEVILDMKVPQNIEVNAEGEVITVEGPLSVAGFVLDSDENFLFLSEDGENVNQAIQLKDIKHIAISTVTEKDPLIDERLLDEETPEDGSYN